MRAYSSAHPFEGLPSGHVLGSVRQLSPTPGQSSRRPAKRSIAAGFVAAVLAALAVPVAAHATQSTPVCGMPTGWYANADEQARLPEPTSGGLKFSGNQLIHHATDTTVEHLSPGGYVAHPAPDQPSFFSVEVSGPDGGYATLRWNTTTHVWDMVTGGQMYSNASPVDLVNAVTPHKSHRVVSFGVGYTANPPGTVTTVVSKVQFGRHFYDLRCHPTPSHSLPASASSSVSASPNASVSSSSSASPSGTTSSSPAGSVVTTTETSAGSGGLAITGPSTGLMVGGAAVVVAGGLGLLLLSRRRRARFTA